MACVSSSKSACNLDTSLKSFSYSSSLVVLSSVITVFSREAARSSNAWKSCGPPVQEYLDCWNGINTRNNSSKGSVEKWLQNHTNNNLITSITINFYIVSVYIKFCSPTSKLVSFFGEIIKATP